MRVRVRVRARARVRLRARVRARARARARVGIGASEHRVVVLARAALDALGEVDEGHLDTQRVAG